MFTGAVEGQRFNICPAAVCDILDAIVSDRVVIKKHTTDGGTVFININKYYSLGTRTEREVFISTTILENHKYVTLGAIELEVLYTPKS